MNKLIRKSITFTTAAYVTLSVSVGTAMAGTGINTGFDPKSNGTQVSGVISNLMQWFIGAAAVVAGGWFLLHLYWAIMCFTAGARNAQKREEGKSHIIHVVVAGVLGGAAVSIAAAIWNWGGTL